MHSIIDIIRPHAGATHTCPIFYCRRARNLTAIHSPLQHMFWQLIEDWYSHPGTFYVWRRIGITYVSINTVACCRIETTRKGVYWVLPPSQCLESFQKGQKWSNLSWSNSPVERPNINIIPYLQDRMRRPCCRHLYSIEDQNRLHQHVRNQCAYVAQQ